MGYIVFLVASLLVCTAYADQPCTQITTSGVCSSLSTIPYRSTCDPGQISYFESVIANDMNTIRYNTTDVHIHTQECADAYARVVCSGVLPRCNVTACSTDPKPALCLASCFDLTLHCGIAPNWCWSVNSTDYTANYSNCSLGAIGYNCMDAPKNLSFCNDLSINFTIGAKDTNPYEQWNVMDGLARDLYESIVDPTPLLLGGGCKDTFKNLICAIYFPECSDQQVLPYRICESMCEEIYDSCPFLNLFAGDDKDCTVNKIYEHDPEQKCQKLEVVKSECFIAGATYGTSADPNVLFLRQFRDEVLKTNYLGRMAVELYLKYSKGPAAVVAASPALRMVSKMCLGVLIFLLKHTNYLWYTGMALTAGTAFFYIAL